MASHPEKRVLSLKNCDHANTELSMRSEFSSSWLREINIMIKVETISCTRGVIAVDQVIVAPQRIYCRGWQSNKQLAIWLLSDYFYSPRTIISHLWRLIARNLEPGPDIQKKRLLVEPNSK